MTCVTDECTQGRKACHTPDQCCERTRRVQEADLRWTRDAIGVECALPIQYPEPDPEPRLSADAKVLIVAVCLFWLAILALSIADPRDLSTIWPRLVALASF